MKASEHDVIEMPRNEAYPAQRGIKCIRCGKYTLSFFGGKPAALKPGCIRPEEKDAAQ